jgi:hypothetical protein
VTPAPVNPVPPSYAQPQAPYSPPPPAQNVYHSPYTGQQNTASAPGGSVGAGLLKNKKALAVVACAVLVLGIGGTFMLKSNGGKSAASSLSTETKQNLERKVDLYAIERSLIQYSTTHNGQYPTLADVNNENFRKANLAGVGINEATDPIGQTAQLSAVAASGVYAYLPAPSKCDNKKVNCTNHKIIATLSDGQLVSLPQ